VEQIRKATGVPAVATAPAVVEALRSKGLRKLAVATPYIDELNEKEVVYLNDYGFEVEIIRGLSIVKNTEIGACQPSVAYRLGRELLAEKANVDGLFISCTNFRTVEILEPLSHDVGKPVISSNQASLWMAFKAVGVHGRCWGLEC
jgi:maleate isomerase